jgi:exonuclease SbcC
MKIAHISDLHCCKEHQEEALKSLEFLLDEIKKNPVDLVAIAGDTWDASMLNTEASGFNDFVTSIQNLADTAPVVMIYGTPSHDTDGSLEVFRKIKAKNTITILEAAKPYFLENGKVVETSTAPEALIFGIPEPRKKYLLANATAGKDETEGAIRDAMLKVCFLLASIRREYSNIPCVMLYHGDIAGSSLQNDRTIERGTGIAISIDELSSIGADYYALGHIHKPQQVGNLPAYYAGSIYPKDFGETHKAGFNFVKIEPGKEADVQRVDFPHPQNIKIEGGTDFSVDAMGAEGDFSGKKVWLEITCTKEERVLLDEDKILSELKKHGAVEGSRVTINEIPTETVRAAEITEACGVSDKFKVWASNTGLELKDSVLQKIAELDTEISKGNAKAQGAWELVSLKLRGSIGIYKGIGKDEIAIDFDSYDSGLIALTGENGKGKTTLIENCHPYPQLLTRKDKLQEQFRLRNSFREVIYRDRDSKRMVKCLIQIDGETKSGSCNYFAYTSDDNGKTWNAVPGVDKNLKPYEDFILQTFGPIELYLRTAFITQRPTKNLPDLTDATAGEKKTLFVELAGIDYLQKFADAANEKVKSNENLVHDSEIKIQMLESTLNRKTEIEKSLLQSETSVKEKQSELDKIIEKGKAAREKLNEAQERFNAEKERGIKEFELQEDVTKLEVEISGIEKEILINQRAAEKRAENEKIIAQYEDLQKVLADEQKKRAAINEANNAKMSEYLQKKAEFDAKKGEIQHYIDSFKVEKNSVEKDILSAENEIKFKERDLAEISDTCPTCGQKLPAEKIEELNAKRKEAESAVKVLEDKISENKQKLNETEKKITELATELSELAFSEPAKPVQDVFDSTIENKANAELQTIDINKAKSELETAKTSAIRNEGLTVQISDKKKLLENANVMLRENQAKRNDKAGKELAEAQTNLDEVTREYTALKEKIAALNATIEADKKTLAEIAESEKELEKVKKDSEKARIEATEWELVSKAFGKDGIQALELDALAPGISETANRILKSGYGDRFSISIETTRIGGSGKKTKQIEDFKIMVNDNGDVTTLENKSGGESVWIKRAIYDAFAVIRRRNTGFAFLTCFQDETDGALDASAKTAYCRMLEASHDAAKLRHTIIITHSNEVKAMIEQKIAMESL